MTKDEALKLALEGAANYIDALGGDSRKYRQALAAPVQEPFGYFRYDMRLDAWVQSRNSNQGTAFYTTPPAAQRQWVGLTDEEIDQGLCRTPYAMKTAEAWREGVRWAYHQLKEKNT
jgi:hypothetical protein